MEGISRQKWGGTRELLAKEKKVLFQARSPFLEERAGLLYYFTSKTQEIPDWLIKSHGTGRS